MIRPTGEVGVCVEVSKGQVRWLSFLLRILGTMVGAGWSWKLVLS
jgi:hypothetical protein